jgi:hypothetical protein
MFKLYEFSIILTLCGTQIWNIYSAWNDENDKIKHQMLNS